MLRSTILSSTIVSVFFDNARIGRFLGTFTVHKKVEVRINRTKTGEDLTSINSNFNFLVYCKSAKNDLSLHCRRKPKQLSKKELSNVAPASIRNAGTFVFRSI